MSNNSSSRRLLMIFIGASLIIIGLSLPLATILGTKNNYNNESGAFSDSENFHLRGSVDIVLYDKYDNIKDERHFDNMIVDSGFEGVASRIAPHDGAINPSSPYNYIALGTGDSPVSASQTALASELPVGPGYSRQHDTKANYTATAGGRQLILTAVFQPGQATGTINESGLFDAATGGDMLARQTFSTINKGTSDTLTVTWTITLTTTP